MTTLFTPDPAEYRDELSLQLDNTRLPTMRNSKILGLTFDPKLTFNEHIKTSKDKAEKTINILKALTSTHWGKNKETLTNTYKTVTRPILEYAGTIYAPIISDKQLTALQVTQNQGLRLATGCTSDTNINHIHDETKILPIEKHLRLHSSQLRQKASHPDHPLHRLTTQPQPPRLKKKTIFNNNQYTLNIDPDPTHAIDENTIKRNMKTIHTTIVQDHLSNRPINKLLNRPPPDIDKKEETLPHSTRRKLSQLRTNKSPLLKTYLHKIDPANHPAANCPLCNDPNHDSLHLFNCPDIPTTLTVWDLWTDPVGVAALLDVWGEKLGGPRAGVWDPVRAHARDGVDTTTTTTTTMGKWSLASEAETDQSDSSAMSLEAKLMSSEVDRPFVCFRVASFSLRMVQSATSISSASCSPLSSSFVSVSHLEWCALISPTISDISLLLRRCSIDALWPALQLLRGGM